MVFEVCLLESCQFPMAANVHRYIRHMGNRTHSAWFSVHKANLAWVFCIDRLVPVFVVHSFVDKIFCCSGGNHGVDCD